MSFDPILAAPPVIQLHIISALVAVVIGPLVLLRRSRDIWHKGLGYAWTMAMGMTALSSFAISAQIGPGPISPVHILSVATLLGLWKGIKAARQRRIAQHQKEIRDIYFWGIGIAGLFTFLPGRRMNIALFGDASFAGFLIMSMVIGTGLAWFASDVWKKAERR